MVISRVVASGVHGSGKMGSVRWEKNEVEAYTTACGANEFFLFFSFQNKRLLAIDDLIHYIFITASRDDSISRCFWFISGGTITVVWRTACALTGFLSGIYSAIWARGMALIVDNTVHKHRRPSSWYLCAIGEWARRKES